MSSPRKYARPLMLAWVMIALFAIWGTAVAEIGPTGIVADSIRLGSLPGGHNVVPNSSFEMASFVTGLSSVTFTDASGTPGWKVGYRTTSPDNMTEGTTLTPTTAVYS